MTICLDIITRSARSMGIVQAGQTPTGHDAADLLQYLQDAIDTLPLLRDGQWTDVKLTGSTDYTATDGERLNATAYSGAITLPLTYQDDCDRTPPTRDLSRVQIIGSEQAGLWVFAASLGSWAKVDGLALNDDSPFGAEDVRGLAAIVATLAMGDYGNVAELSPAVASVAQRAIASFRARFYREVPVGVDAALLRLSDIGFQYGYGGTF
jgi:hypothetical protein